MENFNQQIDLEYHVRGLQQQNTKLELLASYEYTCTQNHLFLKLLALGAKVHHMHHEERVYLGPFPARVMFTAKPVTGAQGVAQAADWPGSRPLTVNYSGGVEVSTPVQVTGTAAGATGNAGVIRKWSKNSSASATVHDWTFEPTFGGLEAVFHGCINTWGGAGGTAASNRGGKLVPRHEIRFKHWRQLPEALLQGGFGHPSLNHTWQWQRVPQSNQVCVQVTMSVQICSLFRSNSWHLLHPYQFAIRDVKGFLKEDQVASP